MLVTLSWSNGHVTGSEGLAWLLKRLWNLRKAMRFAVTEDPCIRHMLPGRVRVYVPGWAGKGKRTIETGLRLIEGVRRVQANPLSGTVLIEYDPAVTDVQIILHEVRALDLETINALDKESPPPPTQMEKRGRIARARIAVRGLDHDPDLAKLMVERLACRSGVVQVKVNWLTGRVLVEFFEHKEDVDALIAEVVGLELPARPEEDRPSHPLDLGPWLQSTLRTIGASLGLVLLGARRLVGLQDGLPGSSVALQVASVMPQCATQWYCQPSPILLVSCGAGGGCRA